ncbi:Fungal specific transcription factor [Penicillium frequentans]|nr:Fungal specific transcription factor [Penicillium glabrum]
MFSHSARFRSEDSPSHQDSDSMRFHNQALDLIYKSLDEASDEQPSLCLLQAMVLVTFYELTKGVKGHAWRLLGSCVRVAYELHLHLIDYEALEENYKVGRDLSRWIEEEEGRRCWWAIWKMDVFASVIRRLPTAIDWNMIDTYLPASDEHWFSNQYCRSCFLERDPVARPKALKDCGNENPDAWLIVITSIIRDAQVLHKGNLQGILMDMNAERCSDQILHYFRNSFSKRKRQEDSSRLQSLVHALQCTTAAMPQSLHHDKSPLDFEAHCSHGVYDAGAKQLQSAKYNIYLSLKHAQFMIYHHHAFDEIVVGTIFCPGESPPRRNAGHPDARQDPQGLKYCLQASDDICSFLSQFPEWHVKHVSPFLASTVWLAASLQVLRGLFGKREQSQDSLRKYMILRTTCERFTAFWNTPQALLDNLDTLETRLSQYSPASSPSTTAGPVRSCLRSPTTLDPIYCRYSNSGRNYLDPHSKTPLHFATVDDRETHNSAADTEVDSAMRTNCVAPGQNEHLEFWETEDWQVNNPELGSWFSQYLSSLLRETYVNGDIGGPPSDQ